MKDIDQRIANLSPDQRALLELKIREKKLDIRVAQTIPRRRDVDSLPLSFAQQRLWFLDQLEQESSFYNISSFFRLTGALDVSILHRSLNAIVSRHEILRTTFESEEGLPFQVIKPGIKMDLPVIDLTTLDESNRETEIRRLAVEEVQKPFKLSEGPLIRGTLLRLDERDHVLLLTMHHIISDGWSMGILKRELSTFYADFLTGKSSSLDELPIQYGDFAHWQRQWLQGEALEKQISYWKERLGGAPSLLELPADRPRPAVQSYRGACESIILPSELSEAIQSLSRSERGTPFITLLAAFQILLYRYTGVEDIQVGSPIANRTRMEIENLIGFFVNTLVLRSDLSGNPSFREFLYQVREAALEAYAHQDCPFEKLVEELQPERNLSYSPIFQVMFAYQNFPSASLKMSDLTLTTIEVDSKTSKFDLTLFVSETEQGLRVLMEYNTDLFNQDTIIRMLGHFQTLLESIANDPDSSISRLPILTKAEQDQLLVEWNDTKTDYPHNKCIHQLFETQVERTPDAVALVYEDEQLTYRELNEQSNQLAHYLRKNGVGPDVLVGIYMERSTEMVIGLLGILKAGGAYVPMDPSYPAERLGFMMSDAKVSILLTTKSLLDEIPHNGAKIVCLSDEEIIRDQAKENPLPESTSDNLVYVIYTSGSTGQPKGVTLHHRALVNLISWQLQNTTLSEGTRTLQFTSLSFDVSFQEIFATLCSGGTLVMIPGSTRQDIEYLASFIASKKIDRLFLPFVALQQLAEVIQFQDLSINLREVITAGEQLQITPAIIRLFSHLKGCSFYNQYGPSESHVVTAYALDNNPKNWPFLPPIGRPIDNVQIYITDSKLQPVPIGVAGELHIGGVGLGRGYLNHPELTGEKFIPHPFNNNPNVRLYKTGDLARYRSDGNIEFLGRIDNQVKIRGFRIELGEIESVLNQHPDVKQVVVLAREDEPGNKRLVAYIVPEEDSKPLTSVLRDFLKKKLPEYMIPSVFVTLESIPLTPNGKVDRKALPTPDQKRPELDKKFVAPGTPTEIKLAEIWCRLLNLKEVGINDNFFDLGGHSLIATQLISRIADAFQVDIPLRNVFETPTVFGLAESVTTALQSDRYLQAPPLKPVQHQEKMSLSFSQQRLWFLDQLEQESSFYNISSFFRLTGALDVPILHRSLNAIVSRHEILRTTFESEEGQPFQVIKPGIKMDLPVIDLTTLDESNRETKIRRLAVEEVQKPFKLSEGPLIRGTLLRLDERDHVLLLTMHHIISDGWSMGILKRELSIFYTDFLTGKSLSLDELPIQYGDFAHWQRQWLQGEVLEKQISYWKERLGGAPSLLELPADRPRPAVQSYRGAWESIILPSELSEAIQSLSRSERGTPFITLLAAFQVLLYRYTGVEDILVGTPFANRKQSKVENLIGFFVNTLVLRSDLSGNPSFREFLHQVRKAALEAYAHQDLPFEKLVEELRPERNLSHSPLFQVMFAFQNFSSESFEMPDLTLTRIEVDSKTSKFDLTLFVSETEQGLRALMEYNTDLFNQDTIIRMLGHFQTLLESIAKDPDSSISVLPILTKAEQDQLLVEWNDTKTDYPHNKCIHQLFETQVERTPDAVALVYEDEQLTYRELNERSNQLAHYLKENGVGPDILVGICMDRSIKMVIGILGILKAGGAYVPLDPAYPKERLAFMLEDTKAPVLLTEKSLLGSYPAEGVQVICMDRVDEKISNYSIENLPNLSNSEDLAYVIYTSGSTGIPKGVEIPHRGVLRLLFGVDYVELGAEEIILQLAPVSFDASTFEIWGPLLHGAKCVLFPERVPTPGDLGDVIKKYGISTLWLTSSLFNTVIDEAPEGLTTLKQLLIGGEALSVSHVRRALELLPSTQIINGYGPTENTTFTCCYQIPRRLCNDMTSIPIGRPIGNTEVRILDTHLNPVPIGVFGELYISGVGLARGYLNQPELTVEKFIPNPFSKDPKSRLYKTGDVVRYLPDGNIEFLGRIDNQVKVSGFRIELGEVEANLVKHPGVNQVVALAREDEPGNKRLVAYIVPEEDSESSTSELRDFLKKKLPDYMIPSVFMMLDSLPLTPNGKVDRKALPRPDQTRPESEEKFVGPRDELDRQLVTAWERVLRISPIGIRDNFFDLGGHSLLGVRLVSEIEKSTGKSIPLKAIFRFSTVEQMADTIKAEDASCPGPEVARKEHASPRLSPEQYKFMLTAIAGGKHQPVRPGSLMMHKNTNGFRRPLFWCFNSPETEMQNLAKYLGNSQPVYGLFSGAGVLKERGINDFKAIANYYINEIVTLQPEGPYFIGGNCGGARVATEIAIGLRAQGKKVGRLCLLEFFDPLLFDYPGKMLLLYGKESHLKAYEPFRWHEPDWSKAFKVVPDVDWVPGGHGEFFREPNIKALARKVSSFLNTESLSKTISGQTPKNAFSSLFGRLLSWWDHRL